MTLERRPTNYIRNLSGVALDERIRQVTEAVQKKYGTASNMVKADEIYVWPQAVYDDTVIVRKGDKLLSLTYVVKNGSVEFTGDAIEVVKEPDKYVAASAYKECETCHGTGQVKTDGKQADCPTCEGTGKMKIAQVHTPGSAAGRQAGKTQLRAAGCGCKGERTMSEKATRSELIAMLVTDKHSGFKDGDEALLETASDARLEEFRAAADARKSAANAFARLETEQRNTAARLKIAEERVKTSEAEMTEDEFLQRAPAGIKALVEAHKAHEAQVRSGLISQLKDLGANTEDELKKKTTEELKTLASYARVDVPDYSGRALPIERTAENRANYAPPDPYKEGLKQLRASKTVN